MQILTNRITVNAALLIDAMGCFAGASVLLLSTTVWSWTDLPSNWRQPVIVALFGFSILLVVAARYKHRVLIALAVLGNIAWITAGGIALFITSTWLGSGIIATVMILDAIMAWLQARGLSPVPDVASNNRH